jgi:hypothetical protein
MRKSQPIAWRFALVIAALVFAACGNDDAAETTTPQGTETAQSLTVTDVNLGSSINNDRSVSAPTSDFAPTDTIYASVATEGSGSGATLMARWLYEDGQVVDESSQTISSPRPALTEFHISMPNGFPTGDYTVEILLNGEQVETESFEIE